MATEREIRSLLEYAIREKDPEAATAAIRVGFWDNVPLHTMTDLHYSLMLLLAAPKQEKRGRKKSPTNQNLIWFMNMACKIRADIDGKSFSVTWEKYCKSTRPKVVADELWRCAGILKMLIQENNAYAKNAANTFKLSMEMLDQHYPDPVEK